MDLKVLFDEKGKLGIELGVRVHGLTALVLMGDKPSDEGI